MKSEAINKPEEQEYPFVGIVDSATTIVLFDAPRRGTVIYSECSHALGSYHKDWVMQCFKPYDGIVNLSNY